MRVEFSLARESTRAGESKPGRYTAVIGSGKRSQLNGGRRKQETEEVPFGCVSLLKPGWN